MAGKSFFVDTSRCTACRGCQAACKQWNQNPGSQTSQHGSYQNPSDLNASTFKLVRFSEERAPGRDPKWFFFPDQCRHCLFPLCKDVADKVAPGSVALDSRTRAIIFKPEVKMSPEAFKRIREVCPFDIPRYDDKGGGMSKCTMCIDRVREGLKPACVQTCPTGAMTFGDRDEILKLARKRLDEVRVRDRKAALVNPESVRVIYLVRDDAEKYHEFAQASPRTGMTRLAALKGLVGGFAAYLGLS